MKTVRFENILFAAAMLPAAAVAGMSGDTPDEYHAWSVHDWNRPKPHRVAFSQTGVPSDAIVLFDGTPGSFARNWRYQKSGCDPWFVENGAMTVKPAKKNTGVETREKFGDCQVHIEFRHPEGTKSIGGSPQMRGNSGVFLMGSQSGYEVQVLESYNTCIEAQGTPEYVDNYTDGQCGSIYAENPPMVNPLKKPGQWQVYDIVFHQPVWDGGKLLHPGSMTVFLNGVLIQDHWEMEGQTTHKKRRPLQPHPDLAPLALQHHGCEVSFRNIWIRRLPSRWANKTHSSMSADKKEVAKLRRKTAAELYAKIKNPKAGDVETLLQLAEVVSYSNEGEWKNAFEKAFKAFKSSRHSKSEIKRVKEAVNILRRNNVVPAWIEL